MGLPFIIPTDAQIQGNLSMQTVNQPAGSILNAQVGGYSGTGNGIGAAKLQQQWQKDYANGKVTDAAASDQRHLHAVYGAVGTLLGFSAWAVTPCVGADTVTVDLYKNGSSILSATISLTNAQSARQIVNAAGFSSASLVAGDILEVKITPNHSSGTLANGVGARLVLREDPQ